MKHSLMNVRNAKIAKWRDEHHSCGVPGCMSWRCTNWLGFAHQPPELGFTDSNIFTVMKLMLEGGDNFLVPFLNPFHAHQPNVINALHENLTPSSHCPP